MVEIKNGGSPPAQLWCGVREESEMNGSMDGEGGGVRKNLSWEKQIWRVAREAQNGVWEEQRQQEHESLEEIKDETMLACLSTLPLSFMCVA